VIGSSSAEITGKAEVRMVGERAGDRRSGRVVFSIDVAATALACPHRRNCIWLYKTCICLEKAIYGEDLPMIRDGEVDGTGSNIGSGSGKRDDA
jgi:hypothetical protein